MSTGGLALLLYNTPYQFDGLQTIGKIVFILNLVIFVTLCLGITYRFCLNRGSLHLALTHPTESLFLPTFFLTLATAINNTALYGEPATGSWLVVALRVLFWLYLAVCLTAVTLQYCYLFSSGPRLTISSMTPAWIMPALRYAHLSGG